MATSAPTRELDGIELPAPGVWTVDPDHSEIAFVARHLMLAKVRGRFTGIDAVIDVAEDPEDTRVEATIDVSSLTSGNDQRDDHLRSANLFDTENWPTAFSRSTGLVWNGSGGSP
jgi:polyisoprenoid-binding protein YceI